MKTQGQFVLLTKEEFKDWLSNTRIVRNINIIQNHHTYEPSYDNFSGNNHFSLLQGMKNYHVNTNKFSDIAQHLYHIL